jgi:hypothetical protein
MNKKQIEVTGASEPFFTYEKDGIIYYEFDSSECVPPEPMVNAMSGLQLIDSQNKRLVMINMKKPMGLLAKIESDFSWENEELEDGKVKIIFSKKSDEKTITNFTDTKCGE